HVLRTAFVMRGMASYEKATVRKLCSTEERVAAAISGDVELEACVLMWFWRVEAVQSVENTDRASFYEFFLLHRSIGLLSEKATSRAVAFRSRPLAPSRSGL
ncbi:hypothetical protein Taro_019776, partial [Colocasia esculenta]|nr:hypothetical protein [Colocasia esculenta]